LDVKTNKFQTTKNSLEWAKNTLSVYPEIKPIIHVLKRFLQTRKLNSSFNGNLTFLQFSFFLL
jgi:DNA polymerase sigma